MSTYVSKRAIEKGLRRVDAKASLVIEVDRRDISASLQKNSKCCAFARACKRQINGVKAAYFFKTAAWLEYETRMVRYILPVSVQKEIVSFDRSTKLEPGIYQINRPQKSMRMGCVKERSAKRPGRHKTASGKTTRKVRHETTNVRSLYEPT